MGANEHEHRHFIYPLNPKGIYVFRDKHGKKWPTNYHGFRHSELLEDPCESTLATGFNKVRAQDLVWVYFAIPDGNIRAVGRAADFPHWNKKWGSHAIYINWDRDLTETLAQHPIPYDAFHQKVQGAVQEANETTQKVIDRWLNDHQSVRTRTRDDSVAFVRREVMTRLGQPAFRQALFRTYNGTCAISGCTVTEALEVAHIQPVGLGGDHSVRNGLVLRADLHTLLDLGLITISDGYKIHVSERIKNTEYGQFHGKPLRLPAHPSERPTLKAVRFHRDLWK